MIVVYCVVLCVWLVVIGGGINDKLLKNCGCLLVCSFEMFMCW